MLSHLTWHQADTQPVSGVEGWEEEGILLFPSSKQKARLASGRATSFFLLWGGIFCVLAPFFPKDETGNISGCQVNSNDFEALQWALVQNISKALVVPQNRGKATAFCRGRGCMYLNPGPVLIPCLHLSVLPDLLWQNKSGPSFGTLPLSSGTLNISKCCLGAQHVTPIRVNMSHVANNPQSTLKIYFNLCFSDPS